MLRLSTSLLRQIVELFLPTIEALLQTEEPVLPSVVLSFGTVTFSLVWQPLTNGLDALDLPQYTSDAMSLLSSMTENVAPEAWHTEMLNAHDESIGRLSVVRETPLFPVAREEEAIDQSEGTAAVAYHVIRRETHLLAKNKS